MDGTLLLLGATGLLTTLGLAESLAHRRNLSRIPIRIHVNGTRGKSTVTRLIASGLRAGGIRTCAKTTGTLPRMIFPDGEEYPVFRPARPNVIEQRRIVAAAVAERAEALVIECMAVNPLLQSLCETKLIRATHGVITNARPDHLDAMGPTPRDVACALAGTIPVGGRLYTAEETWLDVFHEAARDRRSRVVPVDAQQAAAVTSEEMSGFSYIEHAENVALALKVCTDLGINRRRALEGMWSAKPDSGAMTAHRLDRAGRRIVFVNGFAANDPESTARIWDLSIASFPEMTKRIAVFNCRADRTDRSVQLAENCVRWQPADHYLLIGSATNVFIKRAVAMGLDRQKLTCAERCGGEQAAEKVCGLAGPSALVTGMGNIGGPGFEMVEYFRSQSTVTSGCARAA